MTLTLIAEAATLIAEAAILIAQGVILYIFYLFLRAAFE